MLFENIEVFTFLFIFEKPGFFNVSGFRFRSVSQVFTLDFVPPKQQEHNFSHLLQKLTNWFRLSVDCLFCQTLAQSAGMYQRLPKNGTFCLLQASIDTLPKSGRVTPCQMPLLVSAGLDL